MRAGTWRCSLAACSLIAAASCGQSGPSTPESGTIVAGVAAETVLELTLTSPASRLYAFRWTVDEPFQIVTSKPMTEVETCRSGDAFARFLNAVSTLRSRGAAPAITGTVEWARLHISDASGLPPVDALIGIPERISDPITIDINGQQFALDLDPAAVRLPALGCRGLGPS